MIPVAYPDNFRGAPERVELSRHLVVSLPSRCPAAAERGLLSKIRILLFAAAAGGALSAPLAAHAQQSPPPPPPSQQPAEDEPIISDSAFDEALPPLDPALIEPLEPLEQIDPNAPPFPPVPGPVEDAPLGDPALSEPLPPLSTFEVEPAQETAADAEAVEESVSIRYSIEEAATAS